MRFTVYRSKDTAHPRKKHRRILVRVRPWIALPWSPAVRPRGFGSLGGSGAERGYGSPELRPLRTGLWRWVRR